MVARRRIFSGEPRHDHDSRSRRAGSEAGRMNFLFHREHTDPDTAFEQHLQRLDTKREAEQERKSEMAMMKNYLLKLLELCSDEDFGQQAVEAAISHGTLPLTYDLDTDLKVI